ncbi:Sec-independent protein translocase protein TatB [Allomesorhizobium camelthorni]|uniref:Twin-arginine translocase subunit TatB n=1 Tax=Allomesorhizobium camelthorni TaxID=475069 RepID=A0A6G4WLM0_9HYPH|nr:Sec-independent protein translocase protein TatB [Mesorhizobium camelthorni]NGO55083.1 twin-arginine translocase subunit TatB [Mesorhizobium camelthorni]
MFGIGGIELLVIVVVALIVFGPKELPKAMRSAGAMMRTINRVSGEFRSQFDQALREAERELEIEETRKSMEAAIRDTPTPKSIKEPKEPAQAGASASGGTDAMQGNTQDTNVKES